MARVTQKLDPVMGGERISIRRSESATGPFPGLAEEARRGLCAPVKRLPPKFFYDARGSRLFEEITRLPEYYQTVAERGILARVAGSLVRDVRPTALVELGSGSAAKTRVLLDAMQAEGLLRGYAPIDVSESALTGSAEVLVADYPGLRVVGMVGDFELPFRFPFGEERRLIAFLGSTIGNLAQDKAVAFLRRISGQLDDEDAFLVGFDLVKEVGRLEAAYNDASGVTAEFNLNVLRVLNRELGADFDLSAFRHLAFYDPVKSRIEMHLVSTRDQTARLEALDLEISFRDGETIRTEISQKYTRDAAEALLARGGLRLARWETDPQELFALALARRG